MITLDPFQQTALEWLSQAPYRILADDPGVGKTHPSIFAARQYLGPKLLVVPAHLRVNWQYELEQSGETGIRIIEGTPQEKFWAIQNPLMWNLITYQLFARSDYFQALASVIWSVIIFDEAHRLRGRESKSTKAAHALRGWTPRMYFLTGSLIVKGGGDVFPLLKLCDPRKFSSYWRFVEENCKVTETPWAKKVGKPKDPVAFNALLRPYVLRRLLKEVHPEIPEVVYETLRIDIDEATRKSYKQLKLDYLVTNPDGRKTRIGAAGLLSTLRRMVAESKGEALLGLLEDIPEDEQTVVFTWHREVVTYILELLLTAKHSTVGFHGGASTEVREGCISEFKSGKARVLVVTLSTMQEGVNLQNASRVIFVEEDYLATSNLQAIGRLRRRGQERTVVATHIIARKTVDEAVHKVATKRSAMALEGVWEDLWREDTV